MPTILEEGGYRVFVHFNEDGHHVPHVHVETRSGEVCVALGDESTRPYLLGRSRTTKKADARAALRVVEQNQEMCIARWEEYHAA